jgi:hypothetical protein
MLKTVVDNNPGYSYNNRRSDVCGASSRTLPFGKKGVRQACQLNVWLVVGVQVNLFPRRNGESF